jgi:RNA polymerase sigma-70 factor (ECF subfamily)
MKETPVAVQVQAALAGDAAAIEVLVRRVGRITLPLAVAVLGDRHEAGDVAQDVAVEALRCLGRLREPVRFDAWVRTMAVRMTLRAAESRRRRSRTEISLEEAEPTQPADPTDAIAAREALRIALAPLSANQRIALVLRYVHGLSEREIAAALGCRAGTVGSLLSRARDVLRHDESLLDLAATPAPGGGS